MLNANSHWYQPWKFSKFSKKKKNCDFTFFFYRDVNVLKSLNMSVACPWLYIRVRLYVVVPDISTLAECNASGWLPLPMHFRFVSHRAFRFSVIFGVFFFSKCLNFTLFFRKAANVTDLPSDNLSFSCHWSLWNFWFVTIGKYWTFVEHVRQGAASNNWLWAHFDTTHSVASRRIARLLLAGNTKYNCKDMSNANTYGTHMMLGLRVFLVARHPCNMGR